MTAKNTTPRCVRCASARRNLAWAFSLLLPLAAALPRTASAPEAPPQELFQDLFIAVQSAHLYADGKAFPDAVPKTAPADILRQYHTQRPESPAALKQFVEAHFAVPSEVNAVPSPPD